MKRVFFATGQRVIQKVLEWLQLAKEESDVNRRNDYTDYGILKDSLDEFDIVIGDNDNPPVTYSINVKTGIAYDINGDRIEIDGALIPYDPSLPSNTAPDGKGGTVLAPLSTGSQNIGLTANVVNYIWLDYLAVTDTTDFTLQQITNKKQYFKQNDGYEIIVTIVNTPPTSASLLLGTVDLTGGGVVSSSTISIAGRAFSLTKLNRVKIHTVLSDKSDATSTYDFNTDLTLDEHIKAVGAGNVSSNNPHGITPIDIGLPAAGTVEEHQEFFHSGGIIADETSVISALYPDIVTVNPGTDYIVLKSLLPTERVNIDGVVALPTDFLVDHLENFSILDANGTWYLYVDKITKTVQKTQINLVSNPDLTKLLLCQVDWTFPGATGGDLTNLIDHRVFGTIANRDIQDNSIDSSKIAGALTLTSGIASVPTYSFLEDPDTGMYYLAPNEIHLSTTGIDRLIIRNGGVDVVNGELNLINGTEAGPSVRFLNDQNTGMYSSGVDSLGITTGGNLRQEITSSLINFKVPLYKNGVAGIETVDIRNAAIDRNKLSSDVAGAGINGGSGAQLSISASGGLQLSGNSIIIAANGVSSSHLQSSSVTNAKIANGAITGNKFAVTFVSHPDQNTNGNFSFTIDRSWSIGIRGRVDNTDSRPITMNNSSSLTPGGFNMSSSLQYRRAFANSVTYIGGMTGTGNNVIFLEMGTWYIPMENIPF